MAKYTIVKAGKVPEVPHPLTNIPVKRERNVIFIPLPRGMWTSYDGQKCLCDFCKGSEAFLDTLAVMERPELAKEGQRPQATWVVHYPELRRLPS